MEGFAIIITTLIAMVFTTPQEKELIVLLPDDNGKVGALLVQGAGGQILLDEALEQAQVGNGGEVRSGKLDEARIDEIFAETLAAQPPKPVTFVLYFQHGTTQLESTSEPVLEKLFKEVASRSASDVQITGHTDTVGALEDNDRLSLQRAEEIRTFLIGRGLAVKRVRAVGRGERELLVPTEDKVSEPRNRRVEVLVR
ncbi:MAG: OmpA family protein [Chromatiales bacterium]|nr:OmpA family protein [Chromatiales bacterium]